MKYSPYSFSKIEAYASCPNKFKLNYIGNIKVPSENIALEKGGYIHQIIEDFLNDLPWDSDFEFKLATKEQQEEFKKIADSAIATDYYKTLKKLCMASDVFEVERGFSLTHAFLPRDYDDENKLLHGFIDLYAIKGIGALVLDHKTGKKKEERWQSYDQTMLYAMWIMKKYPQVQSVKCVYSYVEHDYRNVKVFTRDELQYIENKYRTKIEKIENDTKFEKNVTKLCNWCDFKGTHCPLTDEELLRVI